MAGFFRRKPEPRDAELDSKMALARAAMSDPYSPEAVELGRSTNDSVKSMFGRSNGTIDFRGLVLEMLEGAPTDAFEMTADHLKANGMSHEEVYEREFAKHWESLSREQRSEELLKLVRFQNSAKYAVPDESGEDRSYEFSVVVALLGAKVSCIAMAFDAQYDDDFSVRLAQDQEAFGFPEDRSDGVAEAEQQETVGPNGIASLLDDEELQKALYEDQVKLEREAASALIALKNAIGASGESFESYLRERESDGDPMDQFDAALIGAALALDAETESSDLEIAGDIVLLSCVDAAFVFAYTIGLSYERNDEKIYEFLLNRLSVAEHAVRALRAIQWVYLADCIACAVDAGDEAGVLQQIELVSSGSYLDPTKVVSVQRFVGEWREFEEISAHGADENIEGGSALSDALAAIEIHATTSWCNALDAAEILGQFMNASFAGIRSSLEGGYIQQMASAEALHELNPEAAEPG